MSEEKLVIGVYDPDAGEDIAYFTVDEHGLIVTFTSDKGIGDAIGRTAETYMIYDDPELVEAIAELWQHRDEYKGKDFKGKLVGVRHPDFVEGEDLPFFHLGARMSRDHYIYTLIALKIWEQRTGERHPKLEEIVKATPFGIRHMARWTLGLILWSKALTGNKFALWLNLVIDLVMMNVITIPMWKLGYWLTGWEEEMDQDEWELIQYDLTKTQVQFQPKWKQKIEKVVYPSYAIMFSAKQLYVTPDTFPKLKKAVQNSLLKMVGKTNYAQQMLLGKKDIPRDKVEAFKTMSGGRWSGYLNSRNDRNMKTFPEGRYSVNLKDVDMVRHLYNETQLDD
jgi:hypothetical protein